MTDGFTASLEVSEIAPCLASSVAQPPVAVRHGWEVLHLPNLTCSVQFCRLADREGSDYFVVNRYGADRDSIGLVVSALCSKGLVVSFSSKGQTAETKLHSELTASEAACLVAISLHHGTLTDDFRWAVEAEGESFLLQTAYQGGCWRSVIV